MKKNPRTSFIVATEVEILHPMRRARPDAERIGAPASAGCSGATCPYMKLHTPEKLYLCLRGLRPEVNVPPELAARARRPIERMLALS